ncbi:MAG: FtsX-like permease family protein [bacterium]|nr:FtsX-like permease family protein [bacterium]
MFKNYLKIAIRNIVRHKGFSFINIAGLALGMACFILIFLLVRDELSFDRFHEHADDIYRVITVWDKKGEKELCALTTAPLAAALEKDIPEITHAACFNYVGAGLVRYGDKSFDRDAFAFTDPSFFKMFSFTFLQGDPGTALDDPLSVVLTEKTAQKYFGDRDPMGKILKVTGIVGDPGPLGQSSRTTRTTGSVNLKVTGVIKDPKQSHIQLEYVVSNQICDRYGLDFTSWNRLNYTTYVMLRKDADVEAVQRKLAGYLKTLFPKTTTGHTLQPLKRIYLHSNYSYDIKGRTSSITFTYILSVLAVFILLIACINFMNLATARSAARMKEVGMRKIIGAGKRQLVRQFLGESIILSFISLLFALFLVELALPYLSRLTFRELSLHGSFDLTSALGLVGTALITGIIAGSYPAFFLSSFKPLKVLKGTTPGGVKGGWLRKTLAIGQFAVSIILIIITSLHFKQFYFMQNADLGYDKNNVVCSRMNADIKKSYSTFKDKLLRGPGILNVTASMNLPNWTGPSFTCSNWEGRQGDEKFTLYHGAVDYDYFKTFKMDILQGRPFSKQFPTDSTSALIVNQQAAKRMGMENPIGKYLSIGRRNGIIIGVVKDHHFDNLRSKINPLVLRLAPGKADHMIIRVKPGAVPASLAFIEEQWKAHAPDYPFGYLFLEDLVERMYVIEAVLGKLIFVFTLLAIFISCMGLFGLVSFMVERRTREIGIRKVLGATVSGVARLLSREFVKWILLANAIAWPIAFLAVNLWLQNYSYRISIGIWTFILAGAAALLIVLLTVAYQTLKVAVANPVDALRYE